MVEREFATLFSGDVESVHVVYDTAKLDKLVEEYEKLHGNLTDLLDDYTSKKRRHKKFKRKQVRSCFSWAGCGVQRARDVIYGIHTHCWTIKHPRSGATELCGASRHDAAMRSDTVACITIKL